MSKRGTYTKEFELETLRLLRESGKSASQLNLESPDSFFPSLLELDAMVETLLVERP
ncbi:MAG: hypothetical protein ACQEQQ_06690 [Chloroflexota bacterium]